MKITHKTHSSRHSQNWVHSVMSDVTSSLTSFFFCVTKDRLRVYKNWCFFFKNKGYVFIIIPQNLLLKIFHSRKILYHVVCIFSNNCGNLAEITSSLFLVRAPLNASSSEKRAVTGQTQVQHALLHLPLSARPVLVCAPQITGIILEGLQFNIILNNFSVICQYHYTGVVQPVVALLLNAKRQVRKW